MTSRTADRLQLGAAALLSVADAVALLPWRDSAAREWLEARGLVVRRPDLPGPVVVWGDVVDELRRAEAAMVQPRRRLRRAGVL